MLRKVLFLATAVSVLLVCNVQAEVINPTWIGGAGGGWSDPCNWSPTGAPYNYGGDVYTVTIDGGTGTVIGLDVYPIIKTLVCNGNVGLRMSSRVHDWTGIFLNPFPTDPIALTNNGNLTLTARGDPDRSFGVFGNIKNSSGAMLHLSGVEIDGYVINETGAEIFIDGPSSVSIDVDNYGLITIRDYTVEINGPLNDSKATLYNAGEVMLYGGDCTIDILHNYEMADIRGFGVIMTEEYILNKGEIQAYGGNLDIITDGYLTNIGTLGNIPLSSLYIKAAEDVNSVGTIEVHADGGVAIDANFINDPGGEIELMGGTLTARSITQRAGATFDGFGNITTEYLTFEPNSIIELTGPTNIVCGVINIAANATLEISDGTTLITGHTTCNNGTIHMIGGRVICQGGLTNNNCNIIWEPGAYTNMADFNLDGTVNFKDFAYFGDTWLWQADWY